MGVADGIVGVVNVDLVGVADEWVDFGEDNDVILWVDVRCTVELAMAVFVDETLVDLDGVCDVMVWLEGVADDVMFFVDDVIVGMTVDMLIEGGRDVALGSTGMQAPLYGKMMWYCGKKEVVLFMTKLMITKVLHSLGLVKREERERERETSSQRVSMGWYIHVTPSQ